MKPTLTFLLDIQSKVFKLLPMREAYDLGFENHIYDFVDNVWSMCNGAIASYPQLSEESALIEVQSNLAFLRDSKPDFNKWRSTVLRSTRLIHALVEKYKAVVD